MLCTAPQRRAARLHLAARLERRHDAAPDSPPRKWLRQQGTARATPARTNALSATPARTNALSATPAR